jgi:hypothetical protein
MSRNIFEVDLLITVVAEMNSIRPFINNKTMCLRVTNVEDFGTGSRFWYDIGVQIAVLLSAVGLRSTLL